MIMTVNEFGERIGVDYVVASNLLKYLVMTDDVKIVGARKSSNGKGKPSTLYDIPNNVKLNLMKNMKTLAKAA